MSVAAGARKYEDLTAVELLAKVQTYDYTGPRSELWNEFKIQYKKLQDILQQYGPVGTVDDLVHWRRSFSDINLAWTREMGPIQFESVFGESGTSSKVRNYPLNILRHFVSVNTQDCDKKVQNMETQKRRERTKASTKIYSKEVRTKKREERDAAAALTTPAALLTAARACLDARGLG